MVKAIAIIQCRLNSTRLPAKAMLDLGGKPLIHRVIDRVKLSSEVDEIWLATSKSPYDAIIQGEGSKQGICVHRGSLDDVLERFMEVVEISRADYAVRITADNPLVPPELINMAVKEIKKGKCDYLTFGETPHGGNVEAFTKAALSVAAKETTDRADREHVTSYFRHNPAKFNLLTLDPPQTLRKPHISITLDTLDDYYFLYHIFAGFMQGRSDIPLAEVLAHIETKG